MNHMHNNKWKEPLFNLFRENKGKKINLPNDNPVEITPELFNNCSPELYMYINVEDWSAFNSKLRNAENIPLFMFDIASRTNWGGTTVWLELLQRLIFALSKDVAPEKIRIAVDWIFLMQDAWKSLDDYGRAILIYESFNDDFDKKYGEKTKFIKGIKTSLKPDSFYKLYLEVEKEFKKPEAKRIPQFRKTHQQIKPIFILMQKKRRFA